MMLRQGRLRKVMGKKIRHKRRRMVGREVEESKVSPYLETSLT